ncbi:hypothetical protein HNR23_003745 [Nocardiopsis mwathae]|uniref:Uncharacterized protein n=1 Tax=Nocardiopsis mwathae TaxID=1472723 RepID=A0A7W9YKL1_9ACTN|nr:hypothetical protein [Nocardiopsis mwathae]MBB6173685.1 hypothetical protein [Nocardiopsis mwathae]
MRAELAEMEHDARAGESPDTGRVEWLDYRKVDGIALYPAVGSQIAELETPIGPTDCVAAPPMTDGTFTWR